MYVIEAVDGANRVMDVFMSYAADPEHRFITPHRWHFTDDHVQPWHSSVYERLEDAQADLPNAIELWGSFEYRQWEGEPASARIVHWKKDGHPSGYQIIGTSDTEIAARWYQEYRQAFRDWIKLLRKTVKHRGETPTIVVAGLGLQ